MKKIKSILIVLSAITLFISCAKDGATGPQGPAGPAGETGPAGSANVTSSTVTVTPGSWSAAGSGLWNVAYSVSAITDGDNDLVMVYMEVSGSTWTPLPLTDWFVAGDNLLFIYTTNTVELEYYSSTAITASQTFKFVVIPQRLVNPNVNTGNYNEVKAAYHLKD